MIDVKKLITGFLILAAAASLSAVILVSVDNGANGAHSSTPQITAVDNTATAPSNAFLSEPSYATTSLDASAAPAITATGAQSSSDPNNLTDQLANAFINGVASTNPNGPQTDALGNQNLTSPDLNSIAVAVVNASATQALQIPDWNYEANAQPIEIENNTSSGAIAQYGAALNDVLSQHFVSTDLSNTVNNASPDPSQLPAIESQIQSALGDTLALHVPKPLAGFQKSLITMLVYEKDELQLAQNVNTDPVKTALIFQEEQAKYNTAIQDLQNKMQQASQLGLSFNENTKTPSDPLAFVDNLLGIPTAHAIFGIGDIVFNPTEFAQMLEDYLNNIILQILKNALVALIQQHVLSWLQGSGAPRFVTQWGTTLINSYEQSAITAINSQFSCLNSSFAPQINLTLGAFYNPNISNFCANSFQAALGGYSVSQFYNNFANGGWLAFGASSLPTNNYYGGLYFKAQIVGQNALNAQQATLARITSSQGFTGDLACDDGSDPTNGTHLECLDQKDNQYKPNANGTCDPGFFPATEPNNGSCGDGTQPQVTTPGTITGFAVNSAIDSNPKLITAANDIVGLLDALTTSLLNSLASAAVSAGTKGILGITASNIKGGGTPPPPLPLACNPQIQSVSSTIPISIGATGGKNDMKGGQPTYSWSSSDGFLSTGYIFSHAYVLPGNYTVTLSDNTGDTPATCNVMAQ